MSIRTHIHDVVSIELLERMDWNNGYRMLRVTTRGGLMYHLGMYGHTSILELLPKAADFADYAKAKDEREDTKGAHMRGTI